MASIDPSRVPGTARENEPQGYALPYYTRLGSDTEYLICNPGPVPVQGSLTAYGPECRPVGEPVNVQLGPNCTQSVRMRPIVPDHAGHTILDVSRPVVVGIVYLRPGDATVVGNALAGRSALVGMPARPAAKTCGFAYRTLPLGPDTLEASLFVSNPNTASLGGQLMIYGERCELLDQQQIGVRPGCTREYRLPAGHYGFGRIRVLAPAVLNLLHFSANAGGLTGAELLNEDTEVPEPPPPGAGVLIDYTHGCRGTTSGDLTSWESAVAAAGITVDHLTVSPVTASALQPYRALAVIMPSVAYDPAEVQAISDFVNAGGGLLVGQDWGIDPAYGSTPWTWPTRSVMGAFGLTDDSNLALDTTHNEGDASRIRFEVVRNFGVHPVVDGLSAISVSATCTLSGGGAAVVMTDTDTLPPNQSVVMERDVGAGRVLALGDSNILSDLTIGELDNRTFGVRCAQRVLFSI